MENLDNFKGDSPVAKDFFDLGWDYYAAKQGMPDDVSAYPAFIDGYETAKTRIKSVRGDRFELKWLQIRYGALKRNRIFDITVTAEILREIDVTHCPITLVPLTHSAGLDSDWSIDRVNNNVGYTMGNLVVVSSKANKSKGCMSYEEIVIAANSTTPTNGLTPFEWLRWRFLSSLNVTRKEEDGISFGYYCAPYVTEFPKLMFVNPSSVLQHAIAKRAGGCRDCNIYPQLTQGLPKSVRQELNGLVRDAAKMRNRIENSECELWFSKKLFNTFYQIFVGLTADSKEIISTNLNKTYNICRPVEMNAPAWNPELRGYNK